jgi:hypothetical protein
MALNASIAFAAVLGAAIRVHRFFEPSSTVPKRLV